MVKDIKKGLQQIQFVTILFRFTKHTKKILYYTIQKDSPTAWESPLKSITTLNLLVSHLLDQNRTIHIHGQIQL